MMDRSPNAAVLFLLAAPLSLAAQNTTLTREGGYWVRTLTGTGPLTCCKNMRVSADGDVNVRGVEQGIYSYIVKMRVKARNESEARRRFDGLRVEVAPRGDTLALGVPRSEGSSDVRVSLPRR